MKSYKTFKQRLLKNTKIRKAYQEIGSLMPLNKPWHLEHKMPNPPAGGPTEMQRLKWHVAHAKHCACRPMPESLKKLIKEKTH